MGLDALSQLAVKEMGNFLRWPLGSVTLSGMAVGALVFFSLGSGITFPVISLPLAFDMYLRLCFQAGQAGRIPKVMGFPGSVVAAIGKQL